MEGYGTSAVIYLKVRTESNTTHCAQLRAINSHKEVHVILCHQALSSESVERLPVFNKSALRHYQATTEADDWCMPSKDPKKLGKNDGTL